MGFHWFTLQELEFMNPKHLQYNLPKHLGFCWLRRCVCKSTHKWLEAAFFGLPCFNRTGNLRVENCTRCLEMNIQIPISQTWLDYDFPYNYWGHVIIPTDFHSIIFQRGRWKTTKQIWVWTEKNHRASDLRSDLVTDSSWTECLRAAKLCTRKLTFRFPARSG